MQTQVWIDGTASGLGRWFKLSPLGSVAVEEGEHVLARLASGATACVVEHLHDGRVALHIVNAEEDL